MALYATAIGLSDNQRHENKTAKNLKFPIKMIIKNYVTLKGTFVSPVHENYLSFYIERFIYEKKNGSKI